jgi:hypothetical protein
MARLAPSLSVLDEREVSMAARNVTLVDSPDVVRFGGVVMSEGEFRRLTDAALIDRLVAGGISRLSADRIVAIERGTAEPSRARTHSQARR